VEWYLVPDFEFNGQTFIKRVKVGGKSVCLVGYDGEVFALGSKCPHAGGDLSQGWCKDGNIVCPLHRYSFDLRTGKGKAGQNDFVNTYPVELKGNSVYIGISSFWENLKQMFK